LFQNKFYFRGFNPVTADFYLVINAAMRAEREAHLGAGHYERSPERRGHANGFKPKTVQTRLGDLTFAVPQVRDGSFYPQALEKGLRSERALRLALAEMYVQGVSTRKVAAIVEQLLVDNKRSRDSEAAAMNMQLRRLAALERQELIGWWRDRRKGHRLTPLPSAALVAAPPKKQVANTTAETKYLGLVKYLTM
jgi:hypothetical protein